MVRYFISYARADGAEVANELANRLRAIGHEVFLDIQGIPGGSEWEKELIRRGKWCDVALVIVTPGSNASRYVYNEFREAEKNHKLIIPVIVDKAPIPPHLSKYNGLPLENKSYDALLLRVETSIRGINAKPIPQRTLFLVPVFIVIAIIAAVVLALSKANAQQSTDTIQTKVVLGVTEVVPTVTFATVNSITSVPTTISNDTPNPTYTPFNILIPSTSLPTIAPLSTIVQIGKFESVPEGAILYQEDFAGNSARGWVSSYGWSVVADTTGNRVYQASSGSSSDINTTLGLSMSFGDAAYEIAFLLPSGNILGSKSAIKIIARSHANTCLGYDIDLYGSGTSLQLNKTDASCSSNNISFGEQNVYLKSDVWYTVRIEIRGNNLSAYLDGIQFASGIDISNKLTSGAFALDVYHAGTVLFDNVRIWKLP